MSFDFFLIFSLLAIVVLVVLNFYELKRDIMMFQQNSYRPERYGRWLKSSGDTTSFMRLVAIFLVLFSLAGFGVTNFATICIILFGIVGITNLARRNYKKPLVVTARVKRMTVVVVAIVALLVALSVAASFCGLFGIVKPLYTAIVTLLIVYCISHFIVISANFIISPVEKNINKGFYKNALNKLQSMPDLKIIGITGSYGKTSTKHYLHRILSEGFETLMTPGSFNTTLGVVRTVNELLKPFHEVFIVEMGAKQNGDIKEICELVNPSVGIITAVGPQHLETFKTLENVRRTKFELVDSLTGEGTAILNDNYDVIAETEIDNCKVVRYSGSKIDNGYYTSDIRYTHTGTQFTLHCPDGRAVDFETSLLGKYNIDNLTAAIATAITLGMDIEKIKYAVRHIEPVEHRLSMRRMANDVILLDDAFNSNPAGASMAVEVLAGITRGRSIIITPGMIELGSQQYERNKELGKKIAEENISYVAIVGNYNRDAISEGLTDAGYDKNNILFFDTFIDANAWMVSFVKSGDVVLIENDLPDTFK